MLSESEARYRLNPAVMHALAVLETFGNDVGQARESAYWQLHCCRPDEFPHWIHVWAVLNGERGGRA